MNRRINMKNYIVGASLKSPIIRSVAQTVSVLLMCSVTAFHTTPALSQNLDLKFEVKANYRDSDEAVFPAAAGADTVETVDPGGNGEISLISLAGKWRPANLWELNFKIDAVDLYDRNPTSTDDEIDIDNLFLRYGRAPSASRIPDKTSFYGQVGKFKKFEQQRERRTESYGLVSTAFNRFEDSGFEFGFDLASGFYGRLSYTTGNPVFIRDPNALAGDNGTEPFGAADPNPDLERGFVLLYDAEVEDFDLSSDPEIGLGLGYRFNSLNQARRFDILAYYYERDLADTTELTGSFQGGDLDLFDVSELPGGEAFSLPVSGNSKTEGGLTAWYYSGNFALFAQYTEQSLAGLDRDGFEIELSYVFDTLFKITPVIRYSEQRNDFSSSPQFPEPALQWDWRKTDYAINIDFNDSLRLIVEYTDNEFERRGVFESHDELLVTLRWQTNFF